MRFIRYTLKNEAPRRGWILNDRIGPVDGDIYTEFQRGETNIPFEDIQLLAPVKPTKIICVGRNYAAHAKEHNTEVPEVPLLFFKPPSSIIAPGKSIVLPPQSQQVEHEAELVIVIGRRGRNITPEDADDHIIGYTIANDVTARDLQRSDLLWTRGKGFDTFCPLGPWIETEFDPADALVTCHVNDEMRQMASTRDMVFTVQQIVAYASSFMTLEVGDIILTGTPAGVSSLSPGDIVKVGVESIGTLSNPVKIQEK